MKNLLLIFSVVSASLTHAGIFDKIRAKTQETPLTSEITNNLKRMGDESLKVQDGKDSKLFLSSVMEMKQQVMKLNAQALGIKSKVLDEESSKLLNIATQIANAFKLKNALNEDKDLNTLSAQLKKHADNLALIERALSSAKPFLTTKREQAKKYLQKAITDVLFPMVDDAISSVPTN